MEENTDNLDDRLGVLLGNLALKKGYISPKALREALTEQSRDVAAGKEARLLGDILVSRGSLTQTQLDRLLADQKTEAPARKPTASPPPAPPPRQEAKAPPPKKKKNNAILGKYLLTRELGRGGMGVVYEAVDSDVDRRVALKLLLTSANADDEEVSAEEERFVREARVSASLQHPHIVGVHEAGRIEDKRYIAMELIQGRQMNEWRKSGSVTIRKQVALLRDVALAVHHAHSQGIIHRDLKPQNILVDDHQQPRVTDFGLAKAVKQQTAASLTASGMVVGTPSYMSPEQAEGKRVDRRTDIYALGVMLFEILTGRVPFKGETPIEILMQKVKQDPPAPSSMVRTGAVDQTIETICLKAIARNPRERYATVEEFSQDLTKWLKGQDVKTTAPKRRAKRPKQNLLIGVGATAALLIVILIFALTGGEDYSVELSRAGQLTREGRHQQALALYDVILAKSPSHAEALAGRKTTHELIAQGVFKQLDTADSHLRNRRYLEAHSIYRNVLARNPGNLRARAGVDLSLRKANEQRDELEVRARSGDEVARKGLAKLNKANSDPPPPLPPPPAPSAPPTGAPKPAGDRDSIFYDPNTPGGSLGLRPVMYRDGPFETVQRDGRWYLRGTPSASGTYSRIYFNVDDAWAAKAQGLTVELDVLLEGRKFHMGMQYDSTDSTLEHNGKFKISATQRNTQTGPRRTLRYSIVDPRFENGQYGVADFRLQGIGMLISRITLRRERLDSSELEPLAGIPFSGKGLRPGLLRELYRGVEFDEKVSVGEDQRIDYVSLPGTGPGKTLAGFYSARWTGYLKAERKGLYAFETRSDDGIRLHIDGVTLISNWSDHPEAVNLGRCVLEPGIHRIAVEYYQKGGQAVVSLKVFGEEGGKIKLLDPAPFFHLPGAAAAEGAGPAPLYRPLADLRGHRQGLSALALSPTGNHAASADYAGEIRLWDLRSGRALGTVGRHAATIWKLAYSVDGSKLIATSGGKGGRVRTWDVQKRKAIRTHPVNDPSDNGQVMALGVSPDGKRFAYGETNGTIRVLDPASGKVLHSFRSNGATPLSIAYAPNARSFVAGRVNGSLVLWNASGTRRIREFKGHTKPVRSLAFTPDGRMLISGGGGNEVRLWEVTTARQIRRFRGAQGEIKCVTVSPDGKTVAAAAEDRTVRTWNLASGTSTWQTSTGKEALTTIAFTSDGRFLVGAGNDWSLKRWETGKRAAAPAARTAVPKRRIAVPATIAWTDSGFDVRNGDRVSFSAEGAWNQQKGSRKVGALGTGQTARDAAMPVVGAKVMSLVGRIGTKGRPFQIVPGIELPMKATGRLYLGPNDDECANNDGEMAVGIHPATARVPAFDRAVDLLWERIVPADTRLRGKTVTIEREGFEDPEAVVVSISEKAITVKRPYGGGSVEGVEPKKTIPAGALETLFGFAVPRPGESDRFLAAIAYAALDDYDRALRTLDLAREAGFDEMEVGGMILRRAREALKGDRRALARVLRKGKRYAEAADTAPASPPPSRSDAVNLLERIDPSRHSISGAWRMEGGALLSPLSDGVKTFGRLLIPDAPKGAYDLSIVLEQLQTPPDGFVSFDVGFVMGQHSSVAVFGGDHHGRSVGIHHIDGKYMGDNGTRKLLDVFSPGKKTRLELAVRMGSVVLSIDGIPHVSWQGDPKRLSLPGGFFKQPPSPSFILGAWSQFRIEKLELTPGSEPPASLPKAAAANGLVGHWTFEETRGAVARDSSGFNHHGEFVGNVERVASRFGRAIRVRGDGAHVMVPNTPRLENLQEGDYTLSVWFRPEGTPEEGGTDRNNFAIVAKRGHHEALRYGAKGEFGMDHWLDPRLCFSVPAQKTVSPGSFHHVAAVIRTGDRTVSVYVDGVRSGSRQWPEGLKPREYGVSEWRFGAASPVTSYQWPAHGTIDEVRMYDRALTAEEIRTLSRP